MRIVIPGDPIATARPKYRKNSSLLKATNFEIAKAYEELQSCQKVGKLFGMCHQSIHERLCRLGLINLRNDLTNEERSQINSLYQKGFRSGDGALETLSKKLKRTIPFISRFAKKMGLTNLNRMKGEKFCEKMSERVKKWLLKNPHPKGMLGKNHSTEYCKKIGIRTSEWWKNATDEQKAQRSDRMVKKQRESGNYNRGHGSWSQSWRTIGGKTKYFRSKWEANYARYLEFLKLKGQIADWLHEPETFWFLEIMRGSRSYLPDFKVINLDGSHYWVEVKGWMDERSATKLKRFAKYYPNEKLTLIQKDWFKQNASMISALVDGWEFDTPQVKKRKYFIKK